MLDFGKAIQIAQEELPEYNKKLRVLRDYYLANVEKAAGYIKSNLFRPPHGHMRFPQVVWLRRHYRIIMWDVVTRDYSPHMTPDDVFNVVKNYTRNGSVIVFHDSLKAESNMREAMPRAIEWLQAQGYEFKVFD